MNIYEALKHCHLSTTSFNNYKQGVRNKGLDVILKLEIKNPVMQLGLRLVQIIHGGKGPLAYASKIQRVYLNCRLRRGFAS